MENKKLPLAQTAGFIRGVIFQRVYAVVSGSPLALAI